MAVSSSDDRGAREQILANVRSAVKKIAPRKQVAVARPIFSAIEEDLVARFRTEAAANYIEVMLTENTNETADTLRKIVESLPAGEVFMQDTSELRAMAATATGERVVQWSSDSGPPEASQAAVSRCEALVAMTGSIMVSSGNCGGRGASVVAPCHIVIANSDQLLPDLESAMARAREIAFDNSFVGLITGCSRTSDIEKLLVIGAHGPRQVVVILQASS